jgi:hypothetical protein
MPIMAAHSRSDARGTARLLAHMARASIDDPKGGEPEEVALNNLYRLLKSFRKDAFFGQELPGRRSPRNAAEQLTLRPPTERNVRQVRDALATAASIAFEDKTRDQAIEVVEQVLRWIAYPKKGALPPSDDRNKTATFLREFISRL